MTKFLLPLVFVLSSCKRDEPKVTNENPQPIPREGSTAETTRQDRLDELTSLFRAESPPSNLTLDQRDANLLLMGLRNDPPVDQENWKYALIIGQGSDGVDIDQILQNHVRSIASSQAERSALLNIIEARRQRAVN